MYRITSLQGLGQFVNERPRDRNVTTYVPSAPPPQPPNVYDTVPSGIPSVPVIMPPRLDDTPKPPSVSESAWAGMTNNQRLIQYHSAEIAARQKDPGTIRNVVVTNQPTVLDRTIEPQAALPVTSALVKPIVITSPDGSSQTVEIATPAINLSPGTFSAAAVPAPATIATLAPDTGAAEGNQIVKWAVIGVGLYILWSTFGTKKARRKVGL
jgi:hypothetical protein